MEKLVLEETFKTPYVAFDPASGILEIKGRVFPENPDEFFMPVLKWLENYSFNPASSTSLHLFLAYFNSTSSEYLFRICKSLETLFLTGHPTTLIWEYEQEDEDMKQIGEDYANLLKLNFELKSVI
jgi:hypothetical protein